MVKILLLTLAFAICHGFYVPEKPHSEYGVPVEYLKTTVDNTIPTLTQDYGVPNQAVPVETEVAVSVPQESNGTPKVQEEYGVPSLPHNEYGVPQVKEVAPVVTQYDYVIPHVEIPVAQYGIPEVKQEYGAPQLNEVIPVVQEEYGVPNKPHNEYGVPQVREVAPVVTQYDYVIPHVEPVATPAAAYGVPTIHEEYGVPNKPHDEYGVPEVHPVAPIVTQYDYVIPHVEPVVAPAAEYGAPNIHEEYGVPNKPHDEYGVPEVHNEIPVITQYDYAIPHVEPVLTPVAEYGVPNIHEEYGVPNKPHNEYGIPNDSVAPQVAPVETKFEYFIPHVEPVPAPVVQYGGVPNIQEEYGAPKVQEEYGVPKVQEEYGVPQVVPVESTYAYAIPAVRAPEVPQTNYGIPTVQSEYGVPNDVPKAPELVIEQAVKPVEIVYEAPAAEYGTPNVPVVVPHAVYGVPTQ